MAPEHAARELFLRVTEHVERRLEAGEVATCYFEGERSAFVRFGRGRVRQAGEVVQGRLALDLIAGARHGRETVGLSGQWHEDALRLDQAAARLRALRAAAPDDPFLTYSRGSGESDRGAACTLPPGVEMARHILDAGGGDDLVGLLAAGPRYTGFASSLGQRDWHVRCDFAFDWSLHGAGGGAVKGRLTGSRFDPARLAAGLQAARAELAVLRRAEHALRRGRYRAYLAPMAVEAILDLLAWEGFGLRAHRTGASPLRRMSELGARLHPAVTVSEEIAGASAPHFQEAGFRRPDRLPLIERGGLVQCLVGPRSALEYGEPCNGAGEAEIPVALALAPGSLSEAEVLAALDPGIYVGNLWYLGCSDRGAARVTGLTRYGCFWVEGGRLQAPIGVMRFDDSLFHLLGDGLLGLTSERWPLADPGSYERRSPRSVRVPGVLVEGLHLTL